MPKQRYLIVILCAVLFNLASATLGAAAQPELRGNVYILGTQDERTPVVNVMVRIEETGDTDVTIDGGAFRIFLPDIFRAGDKITLQVEKEGYQILYPVGGATRVPAELAKERIKIELDELGSHRFLSKAAYRLLVENMAEKSKEQIKGDKDQQSEIDLSRYLKEWATQYGFGLKQVQAELDKWAADVEQKQEDFYELGLAAFYKQNFGAAAEKFGQAAEQEMSKREQVRRQQAALNQQEKELTESIIQSWIMQGKAYYSAYHFKDALIAYQNALSEINKTTDPQRWAALTGEISNTCQNLGIRVGGQEGQRYLTQAVAGYREIVSVFTREVSPQQWAATQNNVGNALQEQGIRTTGEAGTRLLAEAVAVYRAALDVRTRADLPQNWATTQNNLGNALANQGLRTGGEARTRLLAEAVAAYRAALEVHTRADLPQDWATTQTNLGSALANQGIRTVGEAGTRLLAEAVAAYRAVLEVFTRTELPQQWAATQTNLGNALQEQGIRTSDEAGTRLLAEAVAAYRAALEVRTRADLPQDWATTQTNLGSALANQGIRTVGEAGTRLLAEAAAAYRAALEVHTRADLPQQWAMTQTNLGTALQEQGIRTSGEAGTRLLAEAVAAYRAALEVYTRSDLPQHWATTQSNLGFALQAQASLTTDDQKTQLLQEARDILQETLEIYTYEHFAPRWANNLYKLAEIYDTLQDWEHAAECYVNVLKVYPGTETAYQRAGFIYHEHLFRFEEAYMLDWIWVTKLEHYDFSSVSNFIEKHFTTSRFAEAELLLAEVLPQVQAEANYNIGLRAFEIAVLTAQGKTDAIAAKLDELIALAQQQPEDFAVGWTFNGTKHFIQTADALAPQRDWLLSLFTALEAPHRDAIQQQLEAVRAAWEQKAHD